MKTIFPKKLEPNDLVEIIAPAASLSTIKSAHIKLSQKRLQTNLGFKIKFGKHIYEKDALDSSSIKSRIDDLHKAFRNRKAKAIICARGGYNVNTILPYIDWTLIKKNPKPIIGYSDITVLTNAIYAKTGLVTYSGPALITFGIKNDFEYIFDYFQACLMSEEPFRVENSKTWSERKTKAQKNAGIQIMQEGKAEGTIIGGNLCSLNLLQGTPYMPSLKNKILLIEEDDFGGKDTPLEFERNLESLLQLPYANTIRGIIFGRFQNGANMNMKKLRFMLSSKKISKNIPIIADADFGHTFPMITFPIGGSVRINAKGKKASIEILKH